MKKFNSLGIRFTGLLIFCLAVIGLISTILLSISGGAGDYTNINDLFKSNSEDLNGIFKLSGFALTTIFIQLMIFTVSAIKTFIYMKFHRHIFMINLLQNGLLIVSIYYNYLFFGANSFIKLILCILLDLSVIKLVTLSIDLITLNYNYIGKNDVNKSFIGMVIFNLTSKFRFNTLRAYNYNQAQLNKVLNEIETTSSKPLVEKETEDLQEMEADNRKVLENKKGFKLLLGKKTENKEIEKSVIKSNTEQEQTANTDEKKDKELLINAIFENKSKDNICPSISKLEELTNIPKSRIGAIKKDLINDGILTTTGTRSIVNIDSLEQLKV
jgi:hypothetical protein